MSPPRRNADTVFAQAIEIEAPQERAVFLEQACANDPELRREVEKLVGDYFRAGAFLERPAAHLMVTTEEPRTERPGTVIGPYKLLEQIGEGGFGVVFLAEQQQPLRRRVALKVLKPGMDSRQVIARFEAERQALALMDHPHIAKVLDAGATDAGRPYFVMELVKGIPITQLCDDHRLTTRQRLELFVHVCQAVQHAHHKGVIHRDLKPSNVLVTLHDGTPVPKVIDFGIAKAVGQPLTDKTLVTGFAQMIGTPLYMSPEQAGLSGLDVDTRSDVYSLGVLLYELLTGTTPFEKERLRQSAYDEVLRIIREEEAPKPSTRVSTLGQAAPTVADQRQVDPKRLSRLLRGELDWIVLKALEKDRTRRYATAQELADDLRRYLEDEPVQARSPSLVHRARKWARRHRAVVWSATMAIVVAVMMLAGGIGYVVRDRAARLAQAEQKVAEARTAIEAGDFTLAGQRVAEARGHLGAERGLLPAVGADIARVLLEIEAQQGEIDARQADETRSRQFFALLDRAWLTPPSFGREMLPFRKADDRVELLSQALAAYGTGGTPQLKQQLASPINGQSKVVRDALLEAMHELLAAGRCGFAAYCPDQASKMANVTVIHLGRGPEARAKDAHAVAHDALKDIARAGHCDRELQVIYAGDSKSIEWHVVFSWHDKRMFDVLESTDPDPWRRRLRESWLIFDPDERRAAWERLAQDSDVRQQPSRLLTLLANRLESTNEAVRLLRAIQQQRPNDLAANVGLAEKLMESNPPQIEEAVRFYTVAVALKPESSKLRMDLGLALKKLGRPDQADAEFRQAILLAPDKAAAHFALGGACMTLGYLDQAIAELREAARFAPQNAATHNNLGSALHKGGRVEEAVTEYREASRIDPGLALAHHNLGRALYAQGNIKEAMAAFARAIQINPDDEEAKKYLELATRGQGQLAEDSGTRGKAGELRAGLEVDFEAEPGKPPIHLRGLTLGEYVEGSISRFLKRIDRPDYFTAQGVSFYRQGRWERALWYSTKSVSLRSGGTPRDWLFLAMAHCQLDHPNEARQWYEKAVAWMDQNKPQDEELRRFRAEAAALLGIKDEPVGPGKNQPTPKQ
jgi:serine/threonine protein kinase/tetratricopeptide (TPR) repeat protein